MNNKAVIDTVIKILEESDRVGKPFDNPEGARYIMISETLADRMVVWLKDCVVDN